MWTFNMREAGAPKHPLHHLHCPWVSCTYLKTRISTLHICKLPVRETCRLTTEVWCAFMVIAKGTDTSWKRISIQKGLRQKTSNA